MKPIIPIIILYLFILGIGALFGQNGLMVASCFIGAHILMGIYSSIKLGKQIVTESEKRGVHPNVIMAEHRERMRKARERDVAVNKKIQNIDYDKYMDDDHFDEEAIKAEVNRQLAQTPAIVGQPHVTGRSKKTCGTFNGFPIYEYVVFNNTHLFEFNGTTPIENGTPKMMVNEDEIVLESGIVYKFKEMIRQ